jgi:hypothetical protein
MNLFRRALGLSQSGRARTRHNAPRPSALPALEALEDRCLPSTLSGFVYNDVNNNGVRDAGEAGIGGATVTLTGTTNQNQAVNLKTTTDASGAYSFANLAAGTYSLQEAAPSGYLLGKAAVGTQGGTASGASLTNVVLTSNVTGTDYDFGNLATANGWSAIASNFNGTAIPAGSTVWFSSVFKFSGVGSDPVTLSVTNQTISFTANGANTTLSVPNSVVTIDPSATSAVTTFDAASDSWQTTLPTHFSGNGFLGGVSLPVPNGLPGGINPVTWQGQFTSDTPGVSVNWQWAAAVYTSFGTDYNSLNVKPVDDNQASAYKNSDHAGTPEAFAPFVIGGARGGGGSNFTGSYSATASAKPPVPPVPPPPPPPTGVSGYVFLNGVGVGGVTLSLSGVNNLGQSVTLTAITDANGFYSFAGLLPGTYTITQTATPAGSIEASASPGTVNGSTDGSALANGALGDISLASGQQGINYDFFDILSGS